MQHKTWLILVISTLLLFSCKPKPIEINVPQRAASITVSSACLDAHTVAVLATYSSTSLHQLLDTNKENGKLVIPKSLLVDSALVTIHTAGGSTDTLSINSDGLYVKNGLSLQADKQYILTVIDHRKGMTAFATTTFQPAPVVSYLLPEKVNTGKEVITRLKLGLTNVTANSHYFLSYNTMRNARENSILLPMNQRAINLFVPKQIELFTGEGAIDGLLEKSVTLQVKSDDTLVMQIAQVDNAYYEYLKAYKRTGALINQLTGEPINLPSNVSGGLGYFSLYQPVRRLYNLNQVL
jgi:hypothetical protein